MRLKRTLLVTGALLGIVYNAWAQNRLITYPAPEGEEMKNDFVVDVREPGGEWKQVDTYAVKVDEVRDTKHHVEKASLGYFDFSGEVEVKVRFCHGSIETARVRPLSYGIVPTVTDSVLTFRLDRPRNLSVEVNGDIFHNLHLFANPIDVNNPLEGTTLKKLKLRRDLIYFGPGVHRLPGDTLNVPSGKTVYVAGGAVVKGCIRAVNVRDVKILGRGKVHPDGRGAGLSIVNSKNVLVEGLISTQCPTGGSDSVTIRNVKVISSYGWGDGLNVFASNNVLFDGVFCRNSDDCTTVYGTRMGFVGGCRNITMQNSTLWADVAHPIFIGIHGNVENPEVLENLNYVNIDILDHKEKQLDYQGCLAINAGDNNLIRHVRFENIRIENFRQGQLLNLRIFYNKKYCQAPGRGIEDVLFKDIVYTGSNAEVSQIIGYDKERRVKNIRFENLVINGVRIADNMPGKPTWYKTGDMARIFVGEHTEGVTFE
ncbi:glycosyl hydrolase family 28 protein [Bacteroides ndongoniae]|uniref:glycosyl hydrolase family 28 protein n=1 Tax=Bacteroides ndongoniae TaxID=1903262 RepID=UPI0023F94B5F|nr:glycosyl hydrolase family 28 protein [Bacteroides ndongoniae]